jgi:hypothetical protein
MEDVQAMADKNTQFEAMVIPKGARIVTGTGSAIELDVQGDLILQESQKGLTSLTSHHGSILIDEDVVVNSARINAKHMIRVRGRLETDNLKSANIAIEGGSIQCSTIDVRKLESHNGEIETRAITANNVSIKGGNVEIGSIAAQTLDLTDRVRGSILISNAKQRNVDDTVQIKGGFASDIELLGYLLKYRHQIMSDRVLKELKTRKEGREFQQFLLTEKSGPGRDENIDTFATVEIAEPADSFERKMRAQAPSEPAPSKPVDTARPAEPATHASPERAKPGSPQAERLKELAGTLERQLPEQSSRSAMIKLIQASLRQGDEHTLKAVFQRWSGTLEEELKSLSDDARDTVLQIRQFLGISGV